MTDTTEDIDVTPTAFVIADANGQIRVTGIVPSHMVTNQTPPAGGSVVTGLANMDTDYITGGAIAPRPANPAILNGTVLTGLPNPSTVTINGTPYTVTDGELDMTFPNAGTYAINVSSPFPYLDAAFTHTQ